MQIRVRFFSYFQDLTGCSATAEDVPEGATLGQLLKQLHLRYPKIAPLHHSSLLAVGLEYQDPSYVLQPEDEVSLFPPVQGG